MGILVATIGDCEGRCSGIARGAWELQPLARVDAQVHRVGGGGSVGVGVIAVHEWEKLVAGVQ